MSTKSTWKLLGKNPTGERVEENEHGLRRVVLPVGFLMEPSAPHTRWCRLGSAADAVVVASSLAHPHIFKSYGSLAQACAVWSAPVGQPTKECKNIAPLKILVESEMAKRVWAAVVQDRWLPDLPDWASALKRSGAHSWPLGVDVGVMRRWYRGLSWDAYVAAIKRDVASGVLKIRQDSSPSPSSGSGFVVMCPGSSWVVDHNQSTTQSGKRFDLVAWSGSAPLMAVDDAWSSHYIPFSSDQNVVSGYVDPLLNQAQQQARPRLSAEDVCKNVSKLLGVSPDELPQKLSFDQIDAVHLAFQRLQAGQGFLLADETGYGKGRVLASLAQIALNQGIQVLFVTEKKSLFSDFYRDCLMVMQNPSIPALLHSTAVVLDPSGEAVWGSKQRKSPTQEAWVWTTYSQFNRGVKTPKLTTVLGWMKNKKTWVILDESQNASGQSNTADVVRKLEEAGSGVVFSSATFSKNEEHLSAYKNLFDGSLLEWERLQSAFMCDNNLLRTAITLQWAGAGCFLRREHPPVDPPDPLWLSPTQTLRQEQDDFAAWWRAMLDCAKVWSKAFRKEEGPWFKLGGPLSRATRELSLLQKSDFLRAQILSSIQNNQKCVIVSDWTLSGHVKKIVDPSSSVDEVSDDSIDENETSSKTIALTEKPLWKNSWRDIICRDIFADQDLSNVSGLLGKQMLDARQLCLAALDKMPDWGMSPFDDLQAWLEEQKITYGEISGRTLTAQQTPQGWVVAPRAQINRTQIVNQFNSGVLDVVLLTRAGNSGLSLHAGAQFADQRQRHMIEWDVSPDPSVRLQFWGRVRRKDQVNEPQRSVLLIDTPSERRRQHRDWTKQQKLSSHSGKKDNDTISWIGSEGHFVAREWAAFFPQEGQDLGAWFDVDVEKILARSVILPEEKKNDLLVHIDRGVELVAPWSRQHLKSFDAPSFSLQEAWWWGRGLGACVWRQRVWHDRPGASKEAVFDALRVHAAGESQSARDVCKAWVKIWSDWWATQPDQKTPSRVEVLRSWTALSPALERGRGVEVVDPQTGLRGRAVVLGWDAPNGTLPQHWHPSQIGLWLWPALSPEPVLMSLAAWASPQYGALKPLAQSPSPSWFDQPSHPVSALCLEGAAWSVAAWGARAQPKGCLVHIQDEKSGWTWGWRMPQWWTWEHMLASDRELANIDHLMRFCKEHVNGQMRWRWSATEVVDMQAQPGGLVCSGTTATIDLITFPMIQKLGAPKWSADRKTWSWNVPWRHLRWLAHSWSASGASCFVTAAHAVWHQKTFPR